MLARVVMIAWILSAAAPAPGLQEKASTRRHGIEVRPKKYSQTTPKEALASVLATIEGNNIAYLMAHLTDPEFVDKRVAETHQGHFEDLVAEAKTKIEENPAAVKELEQFLKAGEWQDSGNTAMVRLKDYKDRQVFFRKIGDRWFMENRQKEEK
jgi:hypothetical protein